MAYVERKCKLCGIEKWNDREFGAEDMFKIVTWQKWLMEAVKYGMEGEGGALEKMKLVLRDKTGTMEQLLEELATKLESLALNLFTADWQWHRYRALTKDPPEGTAIVCFDFSMNYGCANH